MARRKQTPSNPEAPCPACGSVAVFRVFRKKGEVFRALSAQITGYSGIAREDVNLRHAYSAHQENQCRDCGKHWGNRLNGQVAISTGIKGVNGKSSKTPFGPFVIQALLPISFCGECECEYSVLFQGSNNKNILRKPNFCPYCGVLEPHPTPTQTNWLEKLAEDSLIERTDSPEILPDQTDPDLGPS